MSHSKLRFLPPETCMLEELTEYLCGLPRDELARSLVILPTQRLSTVLLAWMAQRLVAFEPPTITTMERLLQDEGNKAALEAGHPPLSVASDLTIDLIISQIIRTEAFIHLQQGHARELRLFFSEIADADLNETAFERLTLCMTEDIYKNEKHLGSLHSRVQEMHQCWKKLNDFLVKLGHSSRPDFLSRAAASLQKKWETSERLPWDHCWLVGFTSTAESWKPLLASMIEKKNVSFWLNQSPLLYHESSPLQHLSELLAERADTAVPKTAPVSHKHKPVTIINTPSPWAEVALALEHIEQWISDDCPPSRIGLLVTNEGEYGSIIKCLMEVMQIKGNIALATPLSKTTGGIWLQSLIHWLESGEQTTALLNFMCHQTTLEWLLKDVAIADKVDSWLKLRNEIIEKIGASQITSGTDILLQDQKGNLLGQCLEKILNLFSPWLCEIKETRLLGVWISFLQNVFVECEVFGVHASEDQATNNKKAKSSIDQSSQSAIDDFFKASKISENVSQSLVSGHEFLTIINDQLMVQEVRTTGEPLADIQVLSLAEARYMPFARAIILGCNEGTFPKALPKDELLDDYLKRRIGLPGWRSLEAMEDLTFSLLRNRLPHLVLYRPTRNMEENSVRSRFIEKLASEEEALFSTPQFDLSQFWDKHGPKENFLDSQLIHENRSEGELFQNHDDFAQIPKKITHNISASSLEKLIRCPYRFLLHHLKVNDLILPIEGDRRAEGEWLHGVLEAFFTSEYQGKKVIEPWDQAIKNFYDTALKRLLTLTRILGPKNIDSKPIYFHLLHHSWPAFIKHIDRLYPQKSATAFHLGMREARLNSTPHRQGASKQPSADSSPILEPQFSIGGHLRNVTGFMDSIDRWDDHFLLTDYKRQGTPERSAIKKGISPQLPFYIAALATASQDFPIDQAILGYWSILKGEWKSQGVGPTVKDKAISKKLANRSTPDVQELIAAFTDLWKWREHDITESKRFYSDASDCSLCSMAGVCRKNDPNLRDTIEQQSRLSERIENAAKRASK